MRGRVILRGGLLKYLPSVVRELRWPLIRLATLGDVGHGIELT